MTTRILLYLGIALTILCVSMETAAQSEVALATRKAELQTLSETLRIRDEQDRQQIGAIARRMGIPLRRELLDGRILELQRFVPGVGPVFYLTYNVDAADSVSTDEVYAGGSAGLTLEGSGMTVGEWDGGAIAEHPDLLPRLTQMDTPSSVSGHSTHVAGTLIGSGVGNLAARGMAFDANLNAYDWNSDTMEMASAASSGLLLSNHSYGIAAGWLNIGGPAPDNWWWIGGDADTDLEDANFGYYDLETQLWDQIAFDAPYYLIVKAAGNDRWDIGPEPGELYSVVDQAGGLLFTSTLARPADCAQAGGYDCLPTASVAKNVLTVGAVDDVLGGYLPLAGPASVQMTGFSGWGPTDDGRIKPDIVGNGWLLLSTYHQTPFYAAAVGTSMAAPNVTGSLLLLQEHYQNIHGSGNFMRAATLKALAIHTSDETGAADGPDYQYGWGLLNTKNAAQVITDDNVGGGDHQIIEATLLNSATNVVPFTIDQANATITITLAWTDPPGTPVTPSLDPTNLMLVNDLDLRVISAGSTYLPWVLNPVAPAQAASKGDNFRDNVEQVVINAADIGNYTIEVSHKGVLLSPDQNYSLIISVGPPPPISSGLIIDEDFSGGLPAGWPVETLRGAPWTINTPVSGDARLDNLTGSSGKFAMVDNDYSYKTVTSLRLPTLDLSATEAAVLSFNSFFWMDTFESINVDISTNDGTDWNNVWQHQGFSNTPIYYVLDLSVALAGQAMATIRFRFDSEYEVQGNLWQIDDVQLEAFGGVPPPPPPEGDPPGQAANPNPTNGAVDMLSNTTLAWSAGVLTTSHDVYFGTNSSPAFQLNQAGTTFSPGTLVAETLYYWRIDEVNSDATTPGVTWSFTTEAAAPIDPPGIATTPIPSDSGGGSGIDANLSWTADPAATSHDIYFGTGSPPAAVGNQTGTTFNPGTLAHNTTYFWRIDEVNGGGTTTGLSWSFTTETAPVPETMHVGDLDASRSEQGRNRWLATATVLIHDRVNQPLSGATVTGVWSNGSNGGGTCITGAGGQCNIDKSNLKAGVASVSFAVTSVAHADGQGYVGGNNHDPESDSNGTSIDIPHQAEPEPEPSNSPPTATIESPAINTTFASAAVVSFSGSASDAEDGDMSASLVWNSNLDGFIGNGSSFSNTLSDGGHTITATVTDSGGVDDSDSIAITVGSAPEILAHVDGLADDNDSGRRNRWNARVIVSVSDASDQALANAVVDGNWSGGTTGSGACTTDNAGLCTITKNNLKSGVTSVSFTVTDISGTGITYAPGGSTTTIVLYSPL